MKILTGIYIYSIHTYLVLKFLWYMDNRRNLMFHYMKEITFLVVQEVLLLKIKQLFSFLLSIIFKNSLSNSHFYFPFKWLLARITLVIKSEKQKRKISLIYLNFLMSRIILVLCLAHLWNFLKYLLDRFKT